MDKLKAGQRALGIYTPKLPKRVCMPTVGDFGVYMGESVHRRVAREAVLQMEVEKLQELLNEKDEQIDKLSRPMIVRLDLWTIGIVALVFGAHYFWYM